MKKFFRSIIACMVLMMVALFALAACSPKAGELKTVTKGDGVNLRVGIISDTQLAHEPTYDYQYEQHLLGSLELMKARKVEVIIFAGDVGNLLTDYMYQSFQRVWNHVYKDAATAPEKVFIMGNHDYWFENDYNGQLAKKQKMFEQYMGESPWTHKVINGYHFIAYSPTASASYKAQEDWFKKELAIANADGDKPIFVVTHHNPIDTVYGSTAVDGGEGWGLEGINELFEGNERIINISGHSHYSLVDERSIWQGSYTAVQTQSLSYIELEGGKENGSIPPNAEENPMLLIVDLGNNAATFTRVGVLTKQEEGEPWVLPLPLKKETFAYTTEARAAAAVAPTMNMSSDITVTDGKRKDDTAAKVINFASAVGTGESFVHSYHVTLKQNGEQKHFFRYFSDFYLGRNNMASNCAYMLGKDVLPGTYDIEIRAVESFGKVSSNVLAKQIVI